MKKYLSVLQQNAKSCNLCHFYCRISSDSQLIKTLHYVVPNMINERKFDKWYILFLSFFLFEYRMASLHFTWQHKRTTQMLLNSCSVMEQVRV